MQIIYYIFFYAYTKRTTINEVTFDSLSKLLIIWTENPLKRDASLKFGVNKKLSKLMKKLWKLMSANNVKSCIAKDLDGGSWFFSMGIHNYF